MSAIIDVTAKRVAAIGLMEQALIELKAIEDVLGAMRLQHAIDVVRGEKADSRKRD
jgi:hypothetical protein